MTDEKRIPITKAQFDLMAATNAGVQQALGQMTLLRAMLFAQHGISADWQIVTLEDGESPCVTIRGPEKAAPQANAAP